ncbi:class I SAM-dependent methyltransferase [Stieleria sp. TO1_6]|uniref:tRNA (adenine(22)-N(1))-methyltransferase n=1 Tax=Stieleria tagensis TaxID=2956795 RepID=UPI00209B473B|nr:class I SAM-dependent methyltransferase [Stieleria tagensis]MCO8124330.1 class I SAM-dependent methyltransferase [Stieleria tagensis]
MPRLDQRLKCVAQQIRCDVHADIGSDHGHLLKALLMAGRIERGIAIENKQQPFLNSQRNLRGLPAQVRLADGLAGLEPGEADCLSICGMGGQSISQILSAAADRIPPVVILQPNRSPETVRRWGQRQGYRLIDEQVTTGQRAFVILRFQHQGPGDDPAYAGIDRDAAELFGPHLMRRREPHWVRRLEQEQHYLSRLDRLGPDAAQRLKTLDRVLVELSNRQN